MLNWTQVDRNLIAKSRLFHFGFVSMTGDPFRTATLGAVRFARESGLIISYDPNPRPMLWGEPEDTASALWIKEANRISDFARSRF